MVFADVQTAIAAERGLIDLTPVLSAIGCTEEEATAVEPFFGSRDNWPPGVRTNNNSGYWLIPTKLGVPFRLVLDAILAHEAPPGYRFVYHYLEAVEVTPCAIPFFNAVLESLIPVLAVAQAAAPVTVVAGYNY
jgi:hypothetical protein